MKRRIIIVLVMLQVALILLNVNIISFQILAVDNDIVMEITELKPSFSALDIDIEDSLIISYEDIDTSEYECSINTNGITASIVEDSNYLRCEVEAIEGVEFGELTVSAISPDGTELTSTIYTFNNGERMYYSEFAKDQAWYEGVKEWIEEAIDGASDVFTYKYWEEEYSQLMSTILSGAPVITSSNNSYMRISGNVDWEIDDNHTKLPLRNAYVEIIVKNDYEYEVLDSDYTDEDGRYDLQIANLYFSQNSDVYLRINLEAHTFKVRSGWHTFAYYFDQRLSDVVNAGDNVEFNPCIVYDDSMKIYKATHVHQSMVIAERFAAEMGFQSNTKIRVAFPAGIELNDRDWALSQSGFCWGETDGDKYCLIGWNKYDDVETVIHEYSHYIQSSMGNYGEELYEMLLESPRHNDDVDLYEDKGDKRFAMHLTWTEGWGYAFATMAQKYYATEYMGLSNYNTEISLYENYDDYMGEFQEKSVTDFLWSLVDEDKVDCTIDHSAEALDYVFPLTAQEWWNMTTVQGTYRLHDFMRLIYEESYNLGVQLDYKTIKKHISEKLTQFNIAPEIISVITDSPNASPHIMWNPNGSPTCENGEYYSNNKFYVKVFDENLNLIYTSQSIDTNVSNEAECQFTIPQENWNQLIANNDCLNKFYISVEGYRYDSNEDDIVKESGPYYSEYYLYNLNTGHDYSYISENDNAHRYVCYTCNYEELISHTIECTVYKFCHKLSCEICGYMAMPNHTYVTKSVNAYEHALECSVCGYTEYKSHNRVLDRYQEDCHIYACTECEYEISVLHSFECVILEGNQHYEKCTTCDYKINGITCIVYSNVTTIQHTRGCTNCGFSENIFHNFKYVKIDSNNHEAYCLDCGYIKKTEAHSYTYSYTPTFRNRHMKNCVCGDHVVEACIGTAYVGGDSYCVACGQKLGIIIGPLNVDDEEEALPLIKKEDEEYYE